MVEVGGGEDVRLLILEQLSGMEATATAASNCRRLLKGTCPQADFRSDRPAYSEHQHRVFCLVGTRDLQGDTELLE